jgi:hypothetical protein
MLAWPRWWLGPGLLSRGPGWRCVPGDAGLGGHRPAMPTRAHPVPCGSCLFHFLPSPWQREEGLTGLALHPQALPLPCGSLGFVCTPVSFWVSYSLCSRVPAWTHVSAHRQLSLRPICASLCLCPMSSLCHGHVHDHKLSLCPLHTPPPPRITLVPSQALSPPKTDRKGVATHHGRRGQDRSLAGLSSSSWTTQSPTVPL